ncbi:MAG: cupin domain-containing protein [Candidatus Levybacteria bacterium]|nr:cupin domain-containing protein [Candidatus Levybacteria bacterium]
MAENGTYFSVNIGDLPVAANVCQQELREVWRDNEDQVSIAHVRMESGADSLLHEHRVMTEVYHGLEGTGELIVGEEVILFRSGTVVEIPPLVPHKLTNTGEGNLVHMVHAIPAFDPEDVYPLEELPQQDTTDEEFIYGLQVDNV